MLIALYGGELLGTENTHPRSLTFREIKNILGISSEASLSYHLWRLLDSDLIEKLPKKDENGRVYPIYRTTNRGKLILEKLDAIEIIKKRFKANVPKKEAP